MQQVFDLAFLGNYTKDTIVSSAGTRLVDGGAFNYGAHVAAKLGFTTAAITRLAKEDWRVVKALARLGVEVLAVPTPASTCLRVEYPSANVDERLIHVTSTAGFFAPEQVSAVQARAFVIGASLRGEVPTALIETLAAKDTLLAVDVQGFVRVVRDGLLVYEPWPEKEAVLARVDILKTDAVEAEMLTGLDDIYQAAEMLAELGPAEIVLTHRNGLLVHARGKFHEAAFFPEHLVGRSGRGDTCLAAYTARRLSTDPAESTIWAAAITSLKMEAEGPFQRDIADIKELVRDRYRCPG